jgi:hypothetical protein
LETFKGLDMNTRFRLPALAILLPILFSACGGGGGGSSESPSPPPPQSTTLNGISAAGNPVVNGVGYALDATTGTQFPFTTNSTGNFGVTLPVSAIGPFLVHVTGVTSGGAQSDEYSIVTLAQIHANTPLDVTPLSNIVLVSAAGVTPQLLEANCTTNQSACPGLLNNVIAALDDANTAITNVIGPVLNQFGVSPTTFNAYTTTLIPGSHNGLDGVLDALEITPPTNGAINYQISLAGSQLVLATVPLGSAVVAGTTPTPAQLTQAENLATALGEVQTTISLFQNLFAISLPTTSQVSPFIDSDFLNDGVGTVTVINSITAGNAFAVGAVITGGSLSPYSGAPFTGTTPGVNVSYDANNCVTSVWVQFSNNNFLFKDVIPSTNTSSICTGGAWTLAGDQLPYASGAYIGFVKELVSSTASPNYYANLGFNTRSNQTTNNSSAINPYNVVWIGGAGLVSYGDQTTEVGVYLTPPQNTSWSQNPVLNTTTGLQDQYYNGRSAIQSCAAIASGVVPYGVGKQVPASSATACFNSSLTAGTDLTFQYYNCTSATNCTLLETNMTRIYVSPEAVNVPASWYPTIISLNPPKASSFLANVATPMTVNWTLPIGAQFAGGDVELQDSGNDNYDTNINGGATATSASFSIVAPFNAVIGGTNSGGTGNQYSNVEIDVTVGGLHLAAIDDF